VVLTLCFIGATVIVGWWGVAIVGVTWGFWSSKAMKHPVATGLSAAVCAVVAWATLLVWSAALGPLPALVRTLGALAGVPGAVPVVLTLVFAGLLAWSAAAAASRPRK
jgi:hypothetical protein